ECLLVGRKRARAGGDAAGIGVLDDDAGRLGEALDAFPGSVGIGDVVVGELLALQLAVRRQAAGDRALVAVERRALVRVLAIAQVLQPGPRQAEHVGVLAPPPARSRR